MALDAVIVVSPKNGHSFHQALKPCNCMPPASATTSPMSLPTCRRHLWRSMLPAAGLGAASSKVYALSPPDSSLARLALAAGCHRGSVNVLLWCLCFVGVLLDGTSKSIAEWCFHRYCHFPSWVPPLGWCRMAVCGARMYCRCHHQLQRRPSCLVNCG